MRATLPRYRAEDEEAERRASGDAAARLAEALARRQVPAHRLDAAREGAAAEVGAAVEAARAARDPGPEVLRPAVAAPSAPLADEPGPDHPSSRDLSMPEAIRDAMAQEMARDPGVVLLGEDLGKIGGIFGCSRGLRDRFGPERVLDTPISEDNPVVFLEHKLLYAQVRAKVPSIDYAVPIGRAAVRRPGRDATVLATMAMVAPALKAAADLSREHGTECEVIDPRSLRPLDMEAILASVRRTNRLVVAHEGWTRRGFGAEVVAAVAEEAFDWLDAPPARVGAMEVPVPYNDALERAVIPGAADIAAAVRRVLHR